MRVNSANNADIKLEISISHIPALSNNNYIYPIYFCDVLGTPLKLWHDKVNNSINTLASHAVKTTLRLRTTPFKVLSGSLFTRRYIDMNSVLCDTTHLPAGYYVNSLEVDVLETKLILSLSSCQEYLKENKE